MKTDITAQSVRELFHYDATTGVFTRRVNSYRRQDAGSAVGFPHSTKGHLVVTVAGQKVFLHRLAWLYVHGEWQSGHIDHIDGNPRNNRIANLRDVPPGVNTQNQRKPTRGSTSGYLGVTPHRDTGKFQAQIGVDGKNVYLGLYDTAEEAHEAYLLAKRSRHAGCSI